MRFGYAIIAMILWLIFMSWIMTEGGIEISDDTRVLSLAIVAAGAMAGGD